MTSLAGTRALVRLALRRDRITLPVWLYAFVALIVGTAASFSRLYPTVAGRRAFATGVADNPALIALYGRLLDPTSIGALTMWRIGINGAALVGLMGLTTVMRHTRAEEETGRLELLGSAVVGRQAPLTAGLLVALGANLLLGMAIAAGLIVVGLGAPGALAFGLAFVSTGWLFSAVGAVAAQLTETARAANGIGIGVLGLSALLRAAGDSAGGGQSWLSWVSPASWPEQLRPFAGERWWVLALPLLSTAVLLGVAFALVSRRDLGAGLLPARPGPAQAAPALRSPFALAWRLQRGVLAGWTVGFAFGGAVFGSLAAGIGDLLKSSSTLMQTVTRLGGGQQVLVDAYISAVLGIFGAGAAAYALQAALRLRSEETAQRAEPLLATAVTRIRWAGSHLAFPMLGSAVVLAAAGLTAGVTHGLRTHDVATQVPRLLGAALVQLPAVWVLAGIAVALFGLVPRQVHAGWGFLGAFLLLGQLGPVLQLSQWVMDLSPFTHVPRVLGSPLTVTPLIGLAAAAAVLTAVGLAGFRQRDIG
jgi:ABC-2 type transport system permease protein